jgi:hypothetical protein
LGCVLYFARGLDDLHIDPERPLLPIHRWLTAHFDQIENSKLVQSRVLVSRSSETQVPD